MEQKTKPKGVIISHPNLNYGETFHFFILKGKNAKRLEKRLDKVEGYPVVYKFLMDNPEYRYLGTESTLPLLAWLPPIRGIVAKLVEKGWKLIKRKNEGVLIIEPWNKVWFCGIVKSYRDFIRKVKKGEIKIAPEENLKV